MREYLRWQLLGLEPQDLGQRLSMNSLFLPHSPFFAQLKSSSLRHFRSPPQTRNQQAAFRASVDAGRGQGFGVADRDSSGGSGSGGGRCGSARSGRGGGFGEQSEDGLGLIGGEGDGNDGLPGYPGGEEGKETAAEGESHLCPADPTTPLGNLLESETDLAPPLTAIL